MKAWLRQHMAAIASAWQHVRRARGSFSLNVLVVGIAMALPFAGLTLMENLRPVARHLAVAPTLSVFITPGTTRESAQALAPRLSQIVDAHGGGKVAFVPRDAAMAALQQQTGMAEAVAALGDNPLPDAYLVTLEGVDSPEAARRIDRMVASMAALPGVDQVQLDAQWVRRLAAFMQMAQLAVLLLGASLSVVVVAVAFNTIRLQVMTQLEEIDVARLVGATDAFLFRPFYYTGALLGTAAGLLALGGVAASLLPLNQAIVAFTRLYAVEFRLAPLGWPASLTLLAASALLGLLGSALSVRRHLH